MKKAGDAIQMMLETNHLFLTRLTMPPLDLIPQPQFLVTPQRRHLAWLGQDALGEGKNHPAVVWLGGLKSDMRSGKAEALAAWATRKGRSFVRFDYSGHGESGGNFVDGTIGQWLEDSLCLLETCVKGPMIVVGSSLGGWLALLAARELHKRGMASRLAGMVLIAPAVDFTLALMWPRLSEAARQEMQEKGVWMRPNAYGPEPMPISLRLIEESRNHLLMGDTIRSHCPVHILQGMQDPDVPWQHAMTLVEHLCADPVAITLIREGDHRLSDEASLHKLVAAVEMMG